MCFSTTNLNGYVENLEAKQKIFGKVKKQMGNFHWKSGNLDFFVHKFFFVGYLYGGGWVSTSPPHKGKDDAPCCPTIYRNQKKKTSWWFFTNPFENI